MMISPFSRRLAALSILFILLWSGWDSVLAPAFDGIARDSASIAQSKRLLADYARLKTELPELEQRLKQISASGADKAGFLDGPNPAMVAAKLQSDVQQIAASSEVALRRSRTLPPSAEKGFHRIGLELELGATPAGLQRLLHRIETAIPALFVQKLSIRLPEDGTAPAAPDGQPQVSVHMELCGYQRDGAS